ncbi:hypothetical protein SY2F82_06670 [Streptomyces sp. Y2F8-2]|nr:hypothetical protein SY2F82_06670 [Streptomyces sp. Y2F8-2]
MVNPAAAQGNRTVRVGPIGADRFHARTSCAQVIPHRHLTIRREGARELGAPVVVRAGGAGAAGLLAGAQRLLLLLGAAPDPVRSGLPSGAE